MRDDAALVELAQAGDAAAFAELYERYFDRIHDFLGRMARDRAEAADLTQDTFLRAMNNLPALANGASFRSWLFTIARNTALNRLERPARMQPLERTTEDGEEFSYDIVDAGRFGSPQEAAEAASMPLEAEGSTKAAILGVVNDAFADQFGGVAGSGSDFAEDSVLVAPGPVRSRWGGMPPGGLDDFAGLGDGDEGGWWRRTWVLALAIGGLALLLIGGSVMALALPGGDDGAASDGGGTPAGVQGAAFTATSTPLAALLKATRPTAVASATATPTATPVAAATSTAGPLLAPPAAKRPTLPPRKQRQPSRRWLRLPPRMPHRPRHPARAASPRRPCPARPGSWRGPSV